LNDRETERERGEEEEKQAQVEKINPFTRSSTTTPPHLHDRIMLCTIQIESRLQSKAKPHLSPPLDSLGGADSIPKGQIIRREKRREKRACGVVPMLGRAGTYFPTNGKRKESGKWRGEAAVNVTNAKGGGFGEERPAPNAWRLILEDCPIGKAQNP
jgi:hypothetical protein